MKKIATLVVLLTCSAAGFSQHKLTYYSGCIDIECEWDDDGKKITYLDISNDYDDKEYEVSSTGKVFTYEIDEDTKETYTWTFNSKGYATKCVYKYEEKYEDYSYTSTETIEFTYNSQYQMTKWSDSYKSVENDDGDKYTISGTIVNTFTYSNNDLTKITHLWKEKEDGETDVMEDYTYKIEYDSKLANPNYQFTDEFIELFTYFSNTEDYSAECDLSAFAALGFLGKASYHFPTRIVEIDNETKEEDYSWEMSPGDYEMCADDYLLEDDGADYEYTWDCDDDSHTLPVEDIQFDDSDIRIGTNAVIISNYNGSISIYDIRGCIVKETECSSLTTVINISDLSQGIYILKVGNVTRKFVVR